jgi:hypothetical protein
MYQELADLLYTVREMVKNPTLTVDQIAHKGSLVDSAYDRFISKLKKDPVTTPDFWDCECHEKHIHSKQITNCNECGTPQNWRQPDSHLIEVLEMLAKNPLD